MSIINELEKVRQEHGPWTAHNIEIAPGLFTIKSGPKDRAYQRASLYAGLSRTLLRVKKLNGLRVLDLGCLEGGISIALAQQGAKCTGIDVRPQHIIKASFAAKKMGLERKCKWIEADVTDQSTWEKLGKFDIVICSGLLYHLESKEILPLLHNLNLFCKASGITLIDTNISPKPKECIKTSEGEFLWGCTWHEHPPERSIKERLAKDWSSFNNNEAFWLTERSLTNALILSGFGSVIKPLYPYHEWGHKARDIWAALPGNSDPKGLPIRKEPDERPEAHPALVN